MFIVTWVLQEFQYKLRRRRRRGVMVLHHITNMLMAAVRTSWEWSLAVHFLRAETALLSL